MNEKRQVKIIDLMMSVGGLIIFILGFGVMFIAKDAISKSSLKDYDGIIGAGFGALFVVVAFATAYYKVKHKNELKK